MNLTDWLRIRALWLSMGIVNLDIASRTAAHLIRPDSSLVTKVFITIPYPDMRQEKFGVVAGILTTSLW